jgi:hypothetical protein
MCFQLELGIRSAIRRLSARAPALWKRLSKRLAEPSGRLQGKLSSPFFDFDPQVDEE